MVITDEDSEKIMNHEQPFSNAFQYLHLSSSPSSLHTETPGSGGYFSSMMETDFAGGFSSSPSFISPATSGTNYFSVSPQDLQTSFESHRDNVIAAERISVATASAANSSTVGSDFPLIDPNFIFGSAGHGFFS